MFKFGIFYLQILVPFFLIFWSMYTGYQTPTSVMASYWRECEAINFNIPYGNASFNETCCGNTICTESQVLVQGFENFYNSLFSVFMLINGNISDFGNMKLLQNEFTPIVIALHIAFSSFVGLNFFIGLMSNVLSDGAFAQVESQKYMELLGDVMQQEWRLSKSKRQLHLNRIRHCYSPKVLKDRDVIIMQGGEKKRPANDTGELAVAGGLAGNSYNNADALAAASQINFNRSSRGDETTKTSTGEMKQMAQDLKDLKQLFLKAGFNKNA